MAAQKVNQATKVKARLKRLSKKRKRVGSGGDGGLISKKIINR